MRILVVSDLHYRLPHYDWLVDAAADIDVVALVGDLADVVSSVPHEVQTLVLTNYLARRDGLQRQILGEGEQVGGHRSGLVEPADNG